MKGLDRLRTLCGTNKEIWLTMGHEGKAINPSALQFFSLTVLYLLMQDFCFRSGLFFHPMSEAPEREEKERILPGISRQAQFIRYTDTKSKINNR